MANYLMVPFRESEIPVMCQALTLRQKRNSIEGKEESGFFQNHSLSPSYPLVKTGNEHAKLFR